MNVVGWIVGAIVTILFTLLGIEKGKVAKRDKKLKQQEGEIKVLEKTKEATKAESEVTKEVAKEIVEKKEEQVKKEQEVEKAKDADEVIDIANDLVDKFNKL